VIAALISTVSLDIFRRTGFNPPDDCAYFALLERGLAKVAQWRAVAVIPERLEANPICAKTRAPITMPKGKLVIGGWIGCA